MLHSLAYVSRSLIPAHSVELLDIARSSMRNNRMLGLTGALYFDDSQFCQVLEGEQAAVRRLFERIQRDPRHTDVALLREGPVAQRRFENWSMKFVDGAWVPDSRHAFDYDALRAAGDEALEARLSELGRY
jgi:hypothetical protein